MRYNHKIRETPKEVADIMAEYYADTLQPLMEQGFDIELIHKRERDCSHIVNLLDWSTVKYVVPRGVPLHIPHPGIKDHSQNWDYVPLNSTLHQQEQWDIPKPSQFHEI